LLQVISAALEERRDRVSVGGGTRSQHQGEPWRLEPVWGRL